jgi:hypothetical protein
MKSAVCVAVCALCLAVAAVAFPGRDAETATSADAFVDGVGVNVHLHYMDTSYANFSAVENALKELGVRHIRDQIADGSWPDYLQRLNTLGREGIKAILTANVKESDETVVGYAKQARDSIEGYEGPNEYDLGNHPDWAGTLNTFFARMCRAIKADPLASKYPMIAPPVVKSQSFAMVAATRECADYGNLHNYWGGHNPETRGWGDNAYGSYEWNFSNASRAWGSKPIISTETGYFNDLAKDGGVPESVSAKYMPRVLFEQQRHGIKRTYIYEMVDLGSKEKFHDATFGLVHADYSKKPAFRMVQGVLHVLSDPGPAFQAGSLEFTLGGSTENLKHFLMQKRNGTFYLALWVGESGFDVKGKRETPIAARGITIKTTNPMKFTVHRFDDDGHLTESTLGNGTSQNLQVDDHVLILEMGK